MCCRDSSTSFFTIYMLFNSLSSPTALTSTSHRMLTRKANIRRSCLVRDLMRKASGLSLLSVRSLVGFSQVTFTRLRKFPSISSLLSVLSWRCVMFHQYAFCSYLDDIMLLVSYSACMIFQMLNFHCIFGIDLMWL